MSAEDISHICSNVRFVSSVNYKLIMKERKSRHKVIRQLETELQTIDNIEVCPRRFVLLKTNLEALKLERDLDLVARTIVLHLRGLRRNPRNVLRTIGKSLSPSCISPPKEDKKPQDADVSSSSQPTTSHKEEKDDHNSTL